jgi:predicted TIM-barrel fold metal-dependent hydrolase
MKARSNRRSLNLIESSIAGVFCLLTLSSCQEKATYYTAADFEKVPKTDVHFHYNTPDLHYMEFASKLNMRLVSPNVDAGTSIDEQLNIARSLRKAYPGKFAFFGTFSVDSFGTTGFAQNTIARIDECMKSGASGIKIWKNIGMVLKDKGGRYVMVDDPAFEPVFRYLEKNKIPVLGHLGEPKNCWLPLKEMTDSSNCRYYRAHPQYHMYLHPEAPSYEDQINARDNLLQKYLDLDFTGAHLASLEWSVDEIAKRLDKFPRLKVDLSARIAHLQAQSISNLERVRNFMIKYQDRILYGTDVTLTPQDTDYKAKSQMLMERWRADWTYLATDSTLHLKNLPAEVKGLQLPKKVIDNIYTNNADRFFRVLKR